MPALDVRAVGSSATFCLLSWRDRVVVQDVITEAKPGRVAASLETDFRFSDGTWHINRMAHRLRRILGDSEARAESWIGSMGDLWDPKQGHHETTLDNRLTLRAAGFQGSEHDEYVVRAVAKLTSKSRCLLTERERKRLKTSGIDVQELQKHRMQSDDTQLLHLEPAKKVAVERCGKPATVYYWAGQARRAKQSAVSRAQLSADDKTALDDKKKHPRFRVPLHRVMGKSARSKFRRYTCADVARFRRGDRNAMR